MILRDEWDVREVGVAVARPFVEQFHYSRGASNTAVFVFGLFSKHHPDWLAGVTWWLPPTRVAAESVNRERWRDVLSLSRMVVFPVLGRNACSFMLSRAIKRIRHAGRWSDLVTYADESQGHEGGVYRAAGWTYAGRTGPYPRWVDPKTGQQVATQATKTRTAQQMKDLGYVCTGRFHKHKFVYPLSRSKQ